MSPTSRSISSDDLTFYDDSTEDDVSGSRSELEIRAIDDFTESDADSASNRAHFEGRSTSGLFGRFRDFFARLADRFGGLSPYYKIGGGFLVAFIIPWILAFFVSFVIISLFGHLLSPAPDDYSTLLKLGAIAYGITAIMWFVCFITGIIMMIKGVRDIWRERAA